MAHRAVRSAGGGGMLAIAERLSAGDGFYRLQVTVGIAGCRRVAVFVFCAGPHLCDALGVAAELLPGECCRQILRGWGRPIRYLVELCPWNCAFCLVCSFGLCARVCVCVCV